MIVALLMGISLSVSATLVANFDFTGTDYATLNTAPDSVNGYTLNSTGSVPEGTYLLNNAMRIGITPSKNFNRTINIADVSSDSVIYAMTYKAGTTILGGNRLEFKMQGQAAASTVASLRIIKKTIRTPPVYAGGFLGETVFDRIYTK